MNDVFINADLNNVTMLCLLDLSAAFDTIDHDILMRRLENVYGITDVALKWIKSYLTDRYQSVVVDGVKSDNKITQIRCTPRLCAGTRSF